MPHVTRGHIQFAHPIPHSQVQELVEPLAAIIAAADDPRSAWALVIGELFGQVLAINNAAEGFIRQHHMAAK